MNTSRMFSRLLVVAAVTAMPVVQADFKDGAQMFASTVHSANYGRYVAIAATNKVFHSNVANAATSSILSATSEILSTNSKDQVDYTTVGKNAAGHFIVNAALRLAMEQGSNYVDMDSALNKCCNVVPATMKDACSPLVKELSPIAKELVYDVATALIVKQLKGFMPSQTKP